MGSATEAIVAERRSFADTLEAVGPSAPTLAGAWTAADVAAHVVAIDRLGGWPTFLGRTLVSRWAIRLNDASPRFTEWSLRHERARGFDRAVQHLRSAPPRALLRPSVALVGLFEVFVHHEDVRRGSGSWSSRPAPDGLLAVVPWLIRYQHKLLPDVRLVVVGAGTERAGEGGREVVVDGDPGEIVLWLAGRRDAVDLRLTGDDDALAEIRRTDLRI